MPVILNSPYVPPAPAYDKIHLDSFTLTRQRTDYSLTQIQARIRLYYQDPATGKKYFSPDTRDIVIDDAEAWIVQLGQAGDLRGIAAEEHIKNIVALLVETKTDLGTAQAT